MCVRGGGGSKLRFWVMQSTAQAHTHPALSQQEKAARSNRIGERTACVAAHLPQWPAVVLVASSGRRAGFVGAHRGTRAVAKHSQIRDQPAVPRKSSHGSKGRTPEEPGLQPAGTGRKRPEEKGGRVTEDGCLRAPAGAALPSARPENLLTSGLTRSWKMRPTLQYYSRTSDPLHWNLFSILDNERTER